VQQSVWTAPPSAGLPLAGQVQLAGVVVAGAASESA
jgi:hypothetical protein